MIKLALLGWGKESPLIYQTIQENLKGVQLIGVSSGDEEVLQHLRSSSEIKLVERDYRRLLGFHDLDGVVIPSGNDRSMNKVVDAFEAGKNVLMCNPIATNVSEAMTIKAKADQYTTQYASAALPRRYDANVLKVLSLLRKGIIGKISSIRCNAIVKYEEVKMTNSKNIRAGLYMDSMVDDIDMIHFLTGEVFLDVHARGSIRRYEDLAKFKDIDTAMVSAQLSHGIQVQMQCLVSEIPGPEFHVEIEGSQGRLSFYNEAWSKEIQIQGKDELRIFRSEGNNSPYQNIIHSFAHSILKKKLPEDTITPAIQNIKTAVAFSKSDILKEEVDLS
jgi:myo-inositol 2-dehydrogenase/D-chiro-inositol 1-dehydrogenase